MLQHALRKGPRNNRLATQMAFPAEECVLIGIKFPFPKEMSQRPVALTRSMV